MYKTIVIVAILSLISCKVDSFNVRKLSITKIEGLNQLELSWKYRSKVDYDFVEISYISDRDLQYNSKPATIKVEGDNKVIVKGLDFGTQYNFEISVYNKNGEKSETIYKKVDPLKGNKQDVFKQLFKEVIEQQDVELFNHMLEENRIYYLDHDTHPLTNAIKERNWNKIKFILSTNLDYTEGFSDGFTGITTYLSDAIKEGDAQLAKFLVTNGYKYSIDGGVEIPSEFGLAISYGEYELVKMMLDKGTDPNSSSGGREVYAPEITYRTMLEIASRSDKMDIYNLLVDYGADPLIPSVSYTLSFKREGERIYSEYGALHRWRTPEVVPLEDDSNITYDGALKYYPKMLAVSQDKVNLYKTRKLEEDFIATIDKGETVAVMIGEVLEDRDSEILIYIISESGKRGWTLGNNFLWSK